jgi:hypothetical protein
MKNNYDLKNTCVQLLDDRRGRKGGGGLDDEFSERLDAEFSDSLDGGGHTGLDDDEYGSHKERYGGGGGGGRRRGGGRRFRPHKWNRGYEDEEDSLFGGSRDDGMADELREQGEIATEFFASGKLCFLRNRRSR